MPLLFVYLWFSVFFIVMSPLCSVHHFVAYPQVKSYYLKLNIFIKPNTYSITQCCNINSFLIFLLFDCTKYDKFLYFIKYYKNSAP